MTRRILLGIACLYLSSLLAFFGATQLHHSVSIHLAVSSDKSNAPTKPVLFVGFYTDGPGDRGLKIAALRRLADRYPTVNIMIFGGWRPKSNVQNGANRGQSTFIPLPKIRVKRSLSQILRIRDGPRFQQ